MEAQQVGTFTALQKETNFDELCRQIAERYCVETLLVRQLFPSRGNVSTASSSPCGSNTGLAEQITFAWRSGW